MNCLHLCALHHSLQTWEAITAFIDEVAADHLLREQKDEFGRTVEEIVHKTNLEISTSNWRKLEVVGEISSSEGGYTAIVSHEDCNRHFTCPIEEVGTSAAPPENVKRLIVLLDPIIGVLRCSHLATRLMWLSVMH